MVTNVPYPLNQIRKPQITKEPNCPPSN